MVKVYLPCPGTDPGPVPKLSVAVQTLLPVEGAVIAKLTILGVTTFISPQLVQYPADTALPLVSPLPR